METTALDIFKETVKYDHDKIWLKPVCDFFNIDYKYQVDVVRKDAILSSMVEKNSNEIMFGDKRERILLPKKGFVRWIQILNPNIVDADLRTKLIQYQTFIFDFIYGNFEREEQMRIEYARLKKLRALYGKIGREIQRVESNVKLYLDSKFTQLSIDFNEPKKLKI